MLLAKTKITIFVITALSLLGCGTSQMDPASVHRMAVMPFEDATPQKDFGDLADGITQHLTSNLGTAKGVEVIASHSALEYKVRPHVLADIATTLNVDALLEGDVNVTGNTLAISAWLTDAKTGKRVWETKANGKREAAFVLAEQIAESFSKWLNKPLRIEKSTAAPTWQHFLFLMETGKLMHHNDPVDLNLAVYDIDKLRGDYPGFVPAGPPAAELFGRLVSREFLVGDKAREWVKGILYDVREKDPNSAEAFYAEGTLKYFVDWDFAAAETALTKAIDARQNLMYAWHALAQVQMTTNRLPLALETIEKAQKLDPLGYETMRAHALMLAANGRFDEALKTIATAATLTKDERDIAVVTGLIQFGKGDAEAARVQIASLLEGNQEPVDVQALLGAVQAKLGRPAETKRMLALLDSRIAKKYSPADPIHYALLHMSLGDEAKGFAELNSAVAGHRTLALGLPGNLAFTAYKSDPRFQAVIAKLLATKPLQ